LLFVVEAYPWIGLQLYKHEHERHSQHISEGLTVIANFFGSSLEFRYVAMDRCQFAYIAPVELLSILDEAQITAFEFASSNS